MNSRKISVLAAAALLCSGISAVAQEKIPYLDPDRPRAERVEDLLSRLTLHEKLGLMMNSSKGVRVLEYLIMTGGMKRFTGLPVQDLPQCIRRLSEWPPHLIRICIFRHLPMYLTRQEPSIMMPSARTNTRNTMDLRSGLRISIFSGILVGDVVRRPMEKIHTLLP